MTVSPCLRQSHHLGNVSHLPGPTLEWCCWKKQLSSQCPILLGYFPQGWHPSRGCFLSVFSICSLSLPWVGFGTWCWETPAGCAGSRGVGDSGVSGLVIQVFMGWWLRCFYRHLGTHCSQLPAVISRRQMLSICIHIVLRNACSCRKWPSRIAAVATAIVGTCFHCGNWWLTLG